MKKYCIYKHVAPNGKVYIGQTNDIKHRWFPSNYVNSTYFYNAIRKYGWENFQHIILEDNLTLEEANIKEQYYIKLYDATNYEKGYNFRIGGENGGTKVVYSEKFKERYKTVYQYDLEGNYIATWESLTQAANLFTNGIISHITSCCQGERKTAGNYQWKYDFFNKIEAVNPPSCLPKKVIQKDKDDNIICIYNSIQEATKALNMKSSSSIKNVLSGRAKTAYGYKWELLDV